MPLPQPPLPAAPTSRGAAARIHALLLGFCVLLPAAARAAEPPAAPPPLTLEESIRAAVARSLPLLQTASTGAMEQRKQCFMCHNQGLPVLALSTAQSRGIAVDALHLERVSTFTAEFLARNKDNYRQGKGQGGQADTAGYALWTLHLLERPADDTSAAVAEYLLQHSAELDHWRPASRRPPSENSPFTTSFLAVRGLRSFATPEQQPRVEQRLDQVRKWLARAEPRETEDRVFRLWALQLAGASAEEVRLAGRDLMATQNPDGGWGQRPPRDATLHNGSTFDYAASDAYATGSALVALERTGLLAPADAAYQAGVGYLLATQHADGSWHVVSRSDPFQTYFESGFPHGKDQFISCAATGWAAAALLLALPPAGEAAAHAAVPAPSGLTP